MAEVFLCERGQLADEDKHDLRQAGIVVAEVLDIAKVAFVRASEIVSGDDMLWAALDALQTDDGYGSDGRKQREQLALNLFKIVASRRPKAARDDG